MKLFLWIHDYFEKCFLGLTILFVYLFNYLFIFEYLLQISFNLLFVFQTFPYFGFVQDNSFLHFPFNWHIALCNSSAWLFLAIIRVSRFFHAI